MSAARKDRLPIINHLLNASAGMDSKIPRDNNGYPVQHAIGGQRAWHVEAERAALVDLAQDIDAIIEDAGAKNSKERRRSAFACLVKLRDELMELSEWPEHVEDWEAHLKQHRKGDAA